MREHGEPAVTLKVSVLGPLEVTFAGRPVALTQGRLCAVLAGLAMAPGEMISMDRLAEIVWGESLPDNVRRTLQTYVARLRTTFGITSIRTTAGGYVLDVPPEDVDAVRFTRLLDQAAATPDRASERELLLEALGLWRGEPFEGLDSPWLESVAAPRLSERYVSALERRIELDIDADPGIIATLRELTARYPLRERFWVHLMTALYRAGRQADALETYQQLRRTLVDGLGVEPGQEARQAQHLILQQDKGWDTPPRQLPPPALNFVGRDEYLRQLDSFNAPHSTVAIVGGPGVGKTALAVHWAHRIAPAFPDGQLFVNLRGYGPGDPAEPARVLELFLRPLGIAADQLPDGVEARSALFRSTLAGRRVLMVLDNARSAEQIRPLLPGSGLVIVTSRSHLHGLAVREGAASIRLEPFSIDDSLALLRNFLGAQRVAAEPDHAVALAEVCDRLPLAMAIVAERIASTPGLSLAELLAQLRTEQDRLTALNTGEDIASDLRAVFSWSYDALDTESARTFRLLGLNPGNDIDMHAAAALVGDTLAGTRRHFQVLTDHFLLNRTLTGQHEQHDLVRAFATERVLAQETDEDRSSAIQRLASWYLYCADVADRLIGTRRSVIIGAAPGDIAVPFEDGGGALQWLHRNRSNLVATIAAAADLGRHEVAARLAFVLWTYFLQQHAWDDWLTCQRIGFESAIKSGDRLDQARLLNVFGVLHNELRQYDQALESYRQALHLFQELGHRRREGAVQNNLAMSCEALGRFDEAIEHFELAVAAVKDDDEVDVAAYRSGLAHVMASAGRYAEALAIAVQALPVVRGDGDWREQAYVFVTIGKAHAGMGAYDLARDHLCQALAEYVALGDEGYQARTLIELGRLQDRQGLTDDARDSWSQALEIFIRLNDPRAEDARQLLDGLAER